MSNSLTHSRLIEVLDYCPISGIFKWKCNIGKMKLGSLAGTYDTRYKYLMIRIDGKRYFAHRLAWFFIYSKWPLDQIDHKDGNRINNRIDNLRDVTVTVNAQNIKGPKKNNMSTGLLGAYPFKNTGRFVSYIRYGGKKVNLGYFDTALEAHEAHMAAKRNKHEGNLL
jgi:hypothetical protein